jgi:hypothetical protein
LADLEVETAIVAKKMEEAFSTAVVDVGNGIGERRVWAKVDLVVEGDNEAGLECTGRACNDGIEEVAVDGQDSGCKKSQLNQSLEDGSCSTVLLGCDRFP